MESLLRDIRYSVRGLLKAPWFTAAVLFTFALGIGATSATYSIVSSLLLKPISCEKPEELMLLEEAFLTLNGKDLSGVTLDWKEHLQAFHILAAYNVHNRGANVGAGGQPIRVEAAEVTTSFFPLFGVTPVLGRGFAPDDEQPGKNRVTVISYVLWERLFGCSSDVLGLEILLNGTNCTIVGVAPRGFQFPGKAALWIPVSLDAPPILTRSGQGYDIIGRLKPGVTPRQAQLDVDSFGEGIRLAGLNLWPSRVRIKITPLLDQVVGTYRLSILILTGAVGLVLLIACANVTNLLLIRAAARKKDVAVRAALGASQQAIIRQMLVESVLLALLGGSLGLVCAHWFLGFLVALSPPGLVALSKVALDRQAIIFTVAISFFTGVVSGLAPALHGLRMGFSEALKEGGSTSRRGGNGLRNLIVISEIALAVVLLVAAGLLIRSLAGLRKVDPGFDPRNVVTMSFDLSSGDQRTTEFCDLLMERLRAIQGVQSVGAVNSVPLSGGEAFASLIEAGAQPATARLEERFATTLVVTPDYFRAMGIPLLSGRFFTTQDASGSLRVSIVNRSLARQYWPNEDPVGKPLKLGGDNASEIVGVVADVKYLGLESRALPEVYFPQAQNPLALTTIAVRTNSDASKLIRSFRETAHDLDSRLPIYDVKTMDERLLESTSDRRFTALVLSVFAAIALILAAGGIHSVVAYSVSQTTHELGIRIALGARRVDVLILVLRRALFLSLKGTIIGLASALVLTRVLSSLLYELRASDPITLLLTTGGLICISLLASFLPAYKATRVDPAAVLRAE